MGIIGAASRPRQVVGAALGRSGDAPCSDAPGRRSHPRCFPKTQEIRHQNTRSAASNGVSWRISCVLGRGQRSELYRGEASGESTTARVARGTSPYEPVVAMKTVPEPVNRNPASSGVM